MASARARTTRSTSGAPTDRFEGTSFVVTTEGCGLAALPLRAWLRRHGGSIVWPSDELSEERDVYWMITNGDERAISWIKDVCAERAEAEKRKPARDKHDAPSRFVRSTSSVSLGGDGQGAGGAPIDDGMPRPDVPPSPSTSTISDYPRVRNLALFRPPTSTTFGYQDQQPRTRALDASLQGGSWRVICVSRTPANIQKRASAAGRDLERWAYDVGVYIAWMEEAEDGLATDTEAIQAELSRILALRSDLEAASASSGGKRKSVTRDGSASKPSLAHTRTERQVERLQAHIDALQEELQCEAALKDAHVFLVWDEQRIRSWIESWIGERSLDEYSSEEGERTDLDLPDSASQTIASSRLAPPSTPKRKRNSQGAIASAKKRKLDLEGGDAQSPQQVLGILLTPDRPRRATHAGTAARTDRQSNLATTQRTPIADDRASMWPSAVVQEVFEACLDQIESGNAVAPATELLHALTYIAKASNAWHHVERIVKQYTTLQSADPRAAHRLVQLLKPAMAHKRPKSRDQYQSINIGTVVETENIRVKLTTVNELDAIISASAGDKVEMGSNSSVEWNGTAGEDANDTGTSSHSATSLAVFSSEVCHRLRQAVTSFSRNETTRSLEDLGINQAAIDMLNTSMLVGDSSAGLATTANNVDDADEAALVQRDSECKELLFDVGSAIDTATPLSLQRHHTPIERSRLKGLSAAAMGRVREEAGAEVQHLAVLISVLQQALGRPAEESVWLGGDTDVAAGR